MERELERTPHHTDYLKHSSVQLHARASLKWLAKNWQTLSDQQQRRKDHMRFRLGPERNRRKIVAPSIGMAMFDCDPNLFPEDNRILDAKTIRMSPLRD
jgi:hypothetical protein